MSFIQLIKTHAMRLAYILFLLPYWFALDMTAQDTAVKDSVDFYNVTVTATRASAIDPVTFENISLQDIEEVYLGQDPSALLEQLSPSIISYGDAGTSIGNYVQFRLRGMDQTRINTTLNGVPLNDMIDQGVFFSNISDLGNSVGGIQVQRGVGTSTNGVASYAGSINFDGPSLTGAKPSGSLQVLGGSFGTLRTSAEMTSGITDDNLSFYARGTRTTTDGYKYNSGSESYSYFFSGGYFGSKDVLKFTALTGKTQNGQSYLPVLRSEIDQDPRTNINGLNDVDDFAQEMIQLQYSRLLSSNTSWNTTAYYGHSEGIFPFSLDPTTQLAFGLENNQLGLSSDITYDVSSIVIKGGFHAYTFGRDNFNYIAPAVSFPDYVDATTKREISTWAKVNYSTGNIHWSADIQLRSVGLSFDAEEILSYGGPVPSGGIDHNRNWLFFNPKVGISYDLDAQRSLYGSVGVTSREPTRTDILQGDGSAITEFSYTSVLDDQQVKPESVMDIELGYRYRGKKSRLSANAFFMKFTDEIAAVGALADRSYFAVRQNVPSSTRAGVEIQGESSISDKLSATLNATWMTTNVEEFDNGVDVYKDVQHILSPSIITNVGLRLEPSDKWSLQVNGRYVGSSFIELSNNPDFITPSYSVLDAGIQWKVTQRLSLDISGFNLLDALYFNDGAVVDRDFDGITEGVGYRIQPPRHVYIMAKYSW